MGLDVPGRRTDITDLPGRAGGFLMREDGRWVFELGLRTGWHRNSRSQMGPRIGRCDANRG